MEIESDKSQKPQNLGIVGIEIGGYKSLVTHLTRYGIESISNEMSQVEMQSVISFDQKLRVFSDQAYLILKKNSMNTILYPCLYLGTFCQELLQYQPCNLVQQQNKYYFKVQCQKQTFIISTSQALAGFLSYLDKVIFNKLGSNYYLATISIHNGCSLLQKKMLTNSLFMADFNLAQICEEQVAIAYAYLWYKKQDLISLKDGQDQQSQNNQITQGIQHSANQQQAAQNQVPFQQMPSQNLNQSNRYNVLFIDLGQTKLSVFLAQFSALKAFIKLSRTSRELGVRNIDQILLDFFKKKFPSLFKSSKNEEKLKYRFLEAISKHRKILSSNQETQILIESFNNDEDLSYVLTRSEFESLILDRFLNLITDVLQGVCLDLQQQKLDIHEIQIMGGGCRIPVVKQLIQAMFSTQTLGVLMQSESISRGCTIISSIQGNSLNPQIRVDKYEVFNCTNYPMTVSLQINKQVVQQKTVSQYEQLPKQILFLYQLNVPIIPQQKLDVVVDINGELTIQYDIKPQQVFKQGLIYNNIVIELLLTSNAGTVERVQSQLIGKSQDTKLMDQIDLLGKEFYIDDLTNEELGIGKELEKQFKKMDEITIEEQNLGNDIESQIFQYKQMLNDKLKLYISQADHANLLQGLENYILFLDNGRSANTLSLDSLKKLEQEVHNLMDPYIDLLQQKQQEIIKVSSIDELKNIQKIYFKKKISSLNLNLRDKKIAQGKFFGIMKSGSQQIKEILSTISIEEELVLDIGNNSLNDDSFRSILEGLKHNQRLKFLTIDMQSALNQKTTNIFTDLANKYLIQFLSFMSQIQTFTVSLNKIFDQELKLMQQVLESKPNLKFISVTVKNGLLSLDARKIFYNSLVNKLTQNNVDFKYFNEKGQQEFF